jgi:hypothetical protein
MSKPTSLRVNGDAADAFNALRVRLAVSNNNRIPTVTDIVAALIVLGNAHYSELLTALADSEGSE